MTAPAIGITTYHQTSLLADMDTATAMVPYVYVDAVRRAGGRPVLLPAGGYDHEAMRTVADLDGLIIPGGTDLDPSAYGQRRHPLTQPPDHDRDTWEMSCASHALMQGVPLLGICRGMQVLNVTLGGTLHQHLPYAASHGSHGQPGFGTHQVRIAPDGKLAKILPGELHDVPTRHHQGVATLGEGLRVAAQHRDGTIEAVEARDLFALGVQWHPERGTDPRLFDALIEAASVLRVRA